MNYNRLIYCSREEGRRWVEEQERRELGEDKMNKKRAGRHVGGGGRKKGIVEQDGGGKGGELKSK